MLWAKISDENEADELNGAGPDPSRRNEYRSDRQRTYGRGDELVADPHALGPRCAQKSPFGSSARMSMSSANAMRVFGRRRDVTSNKLGNDAETDPSGEGAGGAAHPSEDGRDESEKDEVEAERASRPSRLSELPTNPASPASRLERNERTDHDEIHGNSLDAGKFGVLRDGAYRMAPPRVTQQQLQGGHNNQGDHDHDHVLQRQRNPCDPDAVPYREQDFRECYRLRSEKFGSEALDQDAEADVDTTHPMLPTPRLSTRQPVRRSTTTPISPEIRRQRQIANGRLTRLITPGKRTRGSRAS